MTFAAQNPTISDYYHTFNDVSDRLEIDVFEKGFAVILNTIKKIGASRKGMEANAAATEATTEAATETVSEVAAAEVVEVAETAEKE